MQNSSGQRLVDKVRAMTEELYTGPKPHASWNDDDEALARAEYRIQLAEELLRLGAQLAPRERSAAEDPVVRGFMAEDLRWRYSFHLTRGLLSLFVDANRFDYFNPGRLRRYVSENPESMHCIQQALPDLDRYLAQDMKEETNRASALKVRCSCYRALAAFRLALRDAHELVNAEGDEEAFALLSQCYFDVGDYEKAREAATEAIIRARNDVFQYWAWSNRAEIHRTFGNLAAYEYDKGQAELFRLRAEARRT